MTREQDATAAGITRYTDASGVNIDLHSRTIGSIVGAALGDALGYKVEFASAEFIAAEYPGGISRLYPEWISDIETFAPYSADTQMAREVAEGLIRAGRGAHVHTTAEEVASGFVSWAQNPRDGHRSPEGSCLAACASLAKGASWGSAGATEAGGCGSVARSHPYGLHCLHDSNVSVAQHAALHARMTHGAPRAAAASAAIAVAVREAAIGSAPETVAHEALHAAAYDAATSRMLSAAIKFSRSDAPAPAEILNNWRGWAAHEAMAAGLYCFLRHPDDFLSCIKLAANTSGDSNSIASIAGAISGARLGYGALPSQMLNDLEKCSELVGLATRLHKSATGLRSWDGVVPAARDNSPREILCW